VGEGWPRASGAIMRKLIPHFVRSGRKRCRGVANVYPEDQRRSEPRCITSPLCLRNGREEGGEQQGASRELKAETSLAAIPRRGFPGRILTTRTLTSVRRAVLSKNTGPAIPGSGGVTV